MTTRPVNIRPQGEAGFPGEKTHILTYLVWVFELHVEPAGLDHRLTSRPRSRESGEERGQEKAHSTMFTRDSFRLRASKGWSYIERRRVQRRYTGKCSFQTGLLSTSFHPHAPSPVPTDTEWSCSGNCAPDCFARLPASPSEFLSWLADSRIPQMDFGCLHCKWHMSVSEGQALGRGTLPEGKPQLPLQSPQGWIMISSPPLRTQINTWPNIILTEP